MLGAVDAASPAAGAITRSLLLLVTYGLRAAEVAALTLDDIDWKRDRLAVPAQGRALHRLPAVGRGRRGPGGLPAARPAAQRRPACVLPGLAPAGPASRVAVSACARHYLLKAGIQAPVPGSHTLRHTCVQRLVDAGFGLKAIGDFIGRRSPASTAIYAKVAIEPLRQVALGDGEQVLA